MGQSSPVCFFFFFGSRSIDLTPRTCSRGQSLSQVTLEKRTVSYVSAPARIRVIDPTDQTLRIVLTLSHLRALHDALLETFLSACADQDGKPPQDLETTVAWSQPSATQKPNGHVLTNSD